MRAGRSTTPRVRARLLHGACRRARRGAGSSSRAAAPRPVHTPRDQPGLARPAHNPSRCAGVPHHLSELMARVDGAKQRSIIQVGPAGLCFRHSGAGEGVLMSLGRPGRPRQAYPSAPSPGPTAHPTSYPSLRPRGLPPMRPSAHLLPLQHMSKDLLPIMEKGLVDCPLVHRCVGGVGRRRRMRTAPSRRRGVGCSAGGGSAPPVGHAARTRPPPPAPRLPAASSLNSWRHRPRLWWLTLQRTCAATPCCTWCTPRWGAAGGMGRRLQGTHAHPGA